MPRITALHTCPVPSHEPSAALLPDWAADAVLPLTARPDYANAWAVGVSDGTMTGWFAPVSGAVAALVREQVTPAVIGRDLARWRGFSTLPQAGRHTVGAHIRIAVSATELAAWDLRSRLHQIPIDIALGGRTRNQVPVYATLLGLDIDHPLATDIARWVTEAGFWAQKWRLPGARKNEPAAVDARRLERLRAAVGDDARICIDAGGSWSKAYVRQLLPALSATAVTWLEEPGPLPGGTDIVLAGGEHDYDLDAQLGSLLGDRLTVWQPDPTWNGGLAHTVQMCEIAHLRGIEVYPHGTSLAVTAQVAAVTDAQVVPALECHLTLEPLRQAIYQAPLIPIGGALPLPTTLGLGELRLPDAPYGNHHAA
ncbi:enolase C-terminal domain-like protein [Nocardia niigatensis]